MADRHRISRDVLYADLPEPVVVELDGRLFHDSAQARDRDLERDLDAGVDGHMTIRLGWSQVFDHPCRTAAKIGQVLTSHGWTGSFRACGSQCQVGVRLAG